MIKLDANVIDVELYHFSPLEAENLLKSGLSFTIPYELLCSACDITRNLYFCVERVSYHGTLQVYTLIDTTLDKEKGLISLGFGDLLTLPRGPLEPSDLSFMAENGFDRVLISCSEFPNLFIYHNKR